MLSHLVTENLIGTIRLTKNVRKRKEQMFGDRALAKRFFNT